MLQIKYKEEHFCNECGKTLEQVAWRHGRYLIPVNFQGQAAWGSEQPDVAEGSCLFHGDWTR